MIKIDEYYFPDSIGDKYKYFIRHMHDSYAIYQHVNQFGTVIQAGGHVGLWPMSLANKFDEVITYEPEVENYKCMIENLIENLSDYANVTPRFGALGEQTKYVDLNFSPVNTGGHHIVYEESGEIPMYRLDDIVLNSCDAIVLDIEGQELNALRGAEETIEEFSPVLMLEVKDHVKKGGCTEAELSEYLGCIGYKKVGGKSHDSIYIRA